MLGFSRGMRQRLALERALLHRPRLVLLDEPFTGLDEMSTRALADRLRSLRDDRRIVLIATHDHDIVDGLVDRAVLLRDGRMAELGASDATLRERYRTAVNDRTGGTRGPRSRMRRFFQVAWLVMRKDLRVETRSWEMVSTTLFFAVSCVLVFSFAFVRGGRAIEGAASGILWIAVAFSGTLALGRAFERERYQDAMRALLMAPVERSAIYLGKLLGIVLLMATVEVVVVVAIVFTFGAPLFAYPGYLAALLATGTVGFATVGTLFAAMLLRTRTRGVLLPILLYPVTFPVLIAGVGGTVALMGADPNLDLARFWARCSCSSMPCS